MKIGHSLSGSRRVDEWEGSRPSKFKGGRFHQNHPLDELDHFMISYRSEYQKPLGPSRRHYYEKQTIGTDTPSKPHIKPNQNRNFSSICFGSEQVPKLIKILPKSQKLGNFSQDNSHIGKSKMKKLQTGTLQNGIYRNFYKSQFKEGRSLILPSTKYT